MTAPLAVSAPESEASTLALSEPAGEPNGNSNSTMSTGLSLPIAFLTRDASKTCVTGAHLACPEWPASAPASLARTSASWETLSTTNRDAVLLAIEADSFSKSWRSSENYNPLGWSLRTCRHCSLQTLAKTLRASSERLPSAVMWDSQECWMLNISECPKNAVAFSWSRVLDAIPALTSWLMPRQWNQYLARLARHGSQNRRMLGLAILFRRRQKAAIQDTAQPAPAQILALSFSLLRKTDGVRWLSGSERLAYMDFPADWMRPTLKRLTVRETLSHPQLLNGLLKF